MRRPDKTSRTLRIAEALLLIPLVFVGAYFSGRRLLQGPPWRSSPAASAADWTDPGKRALDRPMPPGPPRARGKSSFILADGNAQVMSGSDEGSNERWADVAGNCYSTAFINSFSYEEPPPEGPSMRLRVEREAHTLRGRLELQGMKPNFAYQIKLRGKPQADPEGFRRIGYAGRWRLPGGGTNFSDQDFEKAYNKAGATAYVLFDYVVTDSAGNAVRDFALDSSLHVLWNVDRQRVSPPATEVTAVVIDASSSELYARPKDRLSVERIWAEPEVRRYQSASKTIRLPAGEYQGEIVLTEESWHSVGNDGGYWATVARAPVHFRILE